MHPSTPHDAIIASSKETPERTAFATDIDCTARRFVKEGILDNDKVYESHEYAEEDI
jgi:hypothetical protein